MPLSPELLFILSLNIILFNLSEIYAKTCCRNILLTILIFRDISQNLHHHFSDFLNPLLALLHVQWISSSNYLFRLHNDCHYLSDFPNPLLALQYVQWISSSFCLFRLHNGSYLQSLVYEVFFISWHQFTFPQRCSQDQWSPKPALSPAAVQQQL